MAIAVRVSELGDIEAFREHYREEMNCQVVHDSIHGRAGWTGEYVLELSGAAVGYGSVAVDGPWRDNPALYEFYVERAHRTRMFDLFASLLPVCGAKIIETQSNARMLTVMLHTFCRNIRAESILFEDSFQTEYAPAGAAFRAATGDSISTMEHAGIAFSDLS